MQEAFHQHIERDFPGFFQKKLLVAVSGGVDSVVLAHLCRAEKLDFALAHANFGLRGKESEADENFVKSLAKRLGVEVYVNRWETAKIADDQRESIQLVARRLRYNWFDQLCQVQAYDFVLTAHHLNDRIETFFINLLRGTGLEGLTGIPAKNGRVVRPLLRFSRQAILTYAKEHHIAWQEDSTNAGDSYLRNRLRHHVVPELQKETTDFENQFAKTQTHLAEAADLIADYRERIYRELTFEKGDYIYYDLSKLKRLPHLKAMVYHLFKDYGFHAWDDIYALIDAQPGKFVLSDRYRLLKDRKQLILGPKTALPEQELVISKPEGVINFPKGKIICKKMPHVTDFHDGKAYIAAEKLHFPLKLRLWKPGDVFQPFGMKGHKKVSDFLKDEELALFEKEDTWVLLSDERIVWVVGHRIDHKFRVRNNTTIILNLELKT